MTGSPTVAVVGCGRWGRNLVRNFAALDALAAVVDTDVAAAAGMAERYGVPAVELDVALKDPGVDALVVAAPAPTHGHIAAQALRSGKDVFVEKPLALRLDDAEELCRLAGEGRRVLMVGHLLQYHPAFLALERLVHEGALGDVRYLYANRLNLGRFRREEDTLWSFAPHDVSMILSLVGPDPVDVWATGGSYLNPGTADVTTTHLRFEGGVRAHAFVSWLHPFKEQKLVVVGSEAMAVFDDGRDWAWKLRLFRHGIGWRDGVPEPLPAEAEAVPVEPAEPLELECRHFLACVSARSTPRTDGREGVRVLRVLDAAARSLAEHVGAGARGVFVHESAYVDQPCDIGEGTRIWHFSHVLAGSRVGRDCTIGQNVMIGPDVTIGDRCKIQNNVSIYKGVTMEDGVFCGPSCVFTNVSNPRAEIDRMGELRLTRVGRGATIGANATVVCGHDIGPWAFVAAGAVVTGDVPPHALVAGVPARRIGWVSHAGERLGDDLVCPRTGRRYRLAGDDGLEELAAPA
ncbi:MAG: Gfo/Idh/MocA family oxidoreductase [Acidimicrobiia bacterium]